MPCFAPKARPRSGSRAATAVTSASAEARAGLTSAAGAMRAAPRQPMRIRSTDRNPMGSSSASYKPAHWPVSAPPTMLGRPWFDTTGLPNSAGGAPFWNVLPEHASDRKIVLFSMLMLSLNTELLVIDTPPPMLLSASLRRATLLLVKVTLPLMSLGALHVRSGSGPSYTYPSGGGLVG